MKKLFAVFLFLVMFFFAPLVEANGWLSGYYNRIKIPIDASKVDAALSNFPVPIKLTSANFDFAAANSDGFDFRFTGADGTTLLKYERERHDSTNKLAEYWVKVPSVSDSADTYIYLYYRTEDTADGADPENVWDSNFKAVHHLKDNTTSAVLDSTSNNNDGTKKGANEPVEATGQIYKAQDFDGTDDYVSLGSGASINITGALAIEAWVYIDSVTGEPSIIDIDALKYGFTTYTSAGDIWFYIHDGGNAAHASCGTGAWHHVVGTWDGTTGENGMKLYIDGTLAAQHTSAYDTTAVSGDTLQLGRRLTANYFDGKIDEARISNVARSAAWIKASYHAGAGSLLKSFVNESLYGNFFLMF